MSSRRLRVAPLSGAAARRTHECFVALESIQCLARKSSTFSCSSFLPPQSFLAAV